jgi:hypothetical protein
MRIPTLLAAIVFAAPVVAQAAGDEADVSAYKDHLKVLTDGKGHFAALLPFTISDSDDTGYFFYSGDGGKTFFAQRRTSGGKDGNKQFNFMFWDPRSTGSSLYYTDKKYTLSCDKRSTAMTALSKEDAQKLLAGAKFMNVKWKRRAYTLARDNNGVYYYVDQAREPEGNKDFHVFKGPKGAVKQQEMVNVVSDGEGNIFVTKNGKLRLVLDKHETSWIQGAGKPTPLTPLDLDMYVNSILVYTELGAYTGDTLGTPCDDL